MKKIGIRWAVYIIVFGIALFAFNILLNQGTTDMTVEMQEATLPVVSVLYGNHSVNTMRGYINKMDCGTMRESISPIGSERELSFSVDTYGAGVSKISYEVRNLDGNRLIENTTVGNYENKHNKIIGTINIKDLIENDKEYNLIFILTMDDGKTAYYYTRIIHNNDMAVAEKLDFIKDFNTKTFSPGEVKDIASFMEPNSKADNTSFGNVNIHNSLNQLGWGTMMPKIQGETEITIHEISAKTASVNLDYIVSVRNGSITNYYSVEESYSIRKGADRFYLLDFNRTMNDIFSAEKESFANNKIVLGILSDSVQMMSSKDGNIIAFENGGRVYGYDVSSNKIATLYSFYKAGDTDLRNIYRKSKAKILSVEENGNITFLIYGYMNRGTHEGECGMLVLYYNSLLNTLEEKVFLEYDKSPEILMADAGRLSYLNNFNEMYVLMDGNIIGVDLESLMIEPVALDIIEDTLYVSDSNKTAVWQNEAEITAELYVMDMKDGFISKVDKKVNDCVKAIGFMHEDLIYGVSHVSEAITNPIGDITLPMDKIVIRSGYGAILKEYDFEDIYVTAGTIENNQISLKRVRKNSDGSYTDIHDDQITNNETEEEGKNKLVYAVTDKFETIAQIEVKNTIDTRTIKFLTPKEVLFEGGKRTAFRQQSDDNRFYLYSKGHIILAHDNPGTAIKNAYELRGTVVDNIGNELYKRGETAARNQIMSIKEESMNGEKSSMAVCLETMLKQQGISRNTEYMLSKGDSAYDLLAYNLNKCYALNLTGCVMDTALYYLDKDIPVLATLDYGKTVLLVGYNEQNVVWYDPVEGTIYKKGMSESRDIFAENENRFLTYIFIDEDK